MLKGIITHGGQAHADEFLAICLLMAAGEYPLIFRREPTPKELADHEMWVIDIGGRLEPELHNFDHHQYKGGKAAFQLVAEHLGYTEAPEVFSWWDTKGKMDTEGPFAVAKGFGTAPSTVFSLQSPIEGAVLKMFQNEGVFVCHTLIVELMEEIGKQLISALKEVKVRLEVLAGRASIHKYDKGSFRGFVLQHDIKDKPSLATEIFRKSLPMADSIAIMISPDDRGDGWSMFRVADHPMVDFTLIKDEEGVLFTHPNGFIAKVSKDADLNKLILNSIKEA